MAPQGFRKRRKKPLQEKDSGQPYPEVVVATIGLPVRHPADACGGNTLPLNAGLGNRGIKAHGTREQAFSCQRRYLLSKGYKQVGGTAFEAPDGGPILILTKKSKYGGKLRMGKANSRHMPDDRLGGIVWML